MKHLNTKRLTKIKPFRVRTSFKRTGLFRLAVYKTNTHLYAQVTSGEGSHIVVGVSTITSFKHIDFRLRRNKLGASLVGKLVSVKASSIGVSKVVFDRSGFQYHGLIQTIAESSRCYGLQL